MDKFLMLDIFSFVVTENLANLWIQCDSTTLIILMYGVIFIDLHCGLWGRAAWEVGE